MANRAEGQLRVTSASDCGNALYANTTSEGRDAVRQQLRQLCERLVKCSERIAAAEKTLEKASASWSAFNNDHDELEQWLETVRGKLAAVIPQNTLQQKKDQLQSLKVVTTVFESLFLLLIRFNFCIL